ncbi:MAG: ankyrin repeat domain-containing protein [bacterium]|nr:ankyrin repeat domain-containing protein [bacterium]
MQYTKLICCWLIWFSVTLQPVFSLTPTEAKKELAKRNIPFTKDMFIQSVLQGDTAVVSLFFTAGMNPNLQHSETGYTALMLAAGSENPALVKMFVQKGAMVNAKTPIGLTAIHFATRTGNLEIVKLLIQSGANVNSADTVFGYTPLMLAAMLGKTDIVTLLLKSGANVTLKSKDGDTAVTLAAMNEYAELAQLLVTAGAPKYGADMNKNLITAIVLNEPEQVNRFLSSGANPDTKDELGKPALVIAAYFGRSDIVKLLLDAGAQENIRLALYTAVMKGTLDIVNLIKQARHLDSITPIIENEKVIGLAYDDDTDGSCDKREYFDGKGLARTEWFMPGKDTPYTISWTVYDKNGIKRGQKISLTGTGIVDAVNEKPPQNRLELAKEVTDPDWNRIVNYTPLFEKHIRERYPELIRQILVREHNPEKDYINPQLNFIYYFDNGRKRNLEYYSRPGGVSFIFETADSNKDGNPEYIIISQWGDWKMSLFDADDNGLPEKYEYPGWIEFDSNQDGQIDRWVVLDERTEQIYLDTNDKSVFDTYQRDTSRKK